MRKEPQETPRACSVCRNGRPAPGGGQILCPKRGVVAPEDCCRAFRYDPLKRVPPRPVRPAAFSEEEFKL